MRWHCNLKIIPYLCTAISSTAINQVHTQRPNPPTQVTYQRPSASRALQKTIQSLPRERKRRRLVHDNWHDGRTFYKRYYDKFDSAPTRVAFLPNQARFIDPDYVHSMGGILLLQCIVKVDGPHRVLQVPHLRGSMTFSRLSLDMGRCPTCVCSFCPTSCSSVSVFRLPRDNMSSLASHN